MSAFRVVCVLVCLMTAALCAPMSCPNSEDLWPCSCKRLAYGLQVICANFNSSTNLMKAFKILRDYRVHTVLLHGLNLPEVLPANLFDGMQIKEIVIQKSELKFSQPAFSGLDSSLFILNVAQRSMIMGQEQFSLARLTKLNELNVQSNHIDKIEDKWLNEKVPNVHTVILDYNEIRDLEGHAFANLQLLQSISLAENQIRTVQRSMFPRPALHLKRIDLSSNQISDLPYDFFFDMPSLRDMVISGNKLTTLAETTWTPVWGQLDLLLLVKNELECDDAMKWIKTYRHPGQFDGNCVLPADEAGKPLAEVYSNT